MPSIKTKIQRRRDKNNAKAKDYYMKKRRAKIGNKKLWQYAFLGKIPIKELWKCYGIIP